MSDPQIPAALLPAVTGVVSLNNFKPASMLTPRAQYTVSAQEYPVVPGDLATIYNLNPAFSGGYTGQGQTIVVIEDTDLYNGAGDWAVFRKTFGLDQYTQGSLTQVHPGPGTGACSDPGINSDDIEAALDVEWSSAAAPGAAIVMASCPGTTNFGGFIALQNLLTNGGPLPSVVSISYGQSETQSGAAFNSYINTLYQTAAAAGVSVFVSAGDAASAGNDRYENVAIHGINVSGWASTIYNVAVGGTDFGDYVNGASSTFWNSSNGASYSSAAFTQGQTGATYSLTVSNGSGAGPTNGPVTVTEILPAALTLATMAGSGWTCSAAAAPSCTRSDALSGGSSYPAVTVTVNVSATAPGQSTNQAGVSGGGGNIAGSEDLTIVAPPSVAAAAGVHERM